MADFKVRLFNLKRKKARKSNSEYSKVDTH